MVVHIPSFVHETQLVCPIYLCMIPFWTTSNPILISDLANAICFDLCEILTTELISTSTPSLDHVQIWRCRRLWIHTWNMWWKLLGADKAWYFEVKVSSMILQEDWWWQDTWPLMCACRSEFDNVWEEITAFIVCSALLNEFWWGFTMLQWSFHEQ